MVSLIFWKKQRSRCFLIMITKRGKMLDFFRKVCYNKEGSYKTYVKIIDKGVKICLIHLMRKEILFLN